MINPYHVDIPFPFLNDTSLWLPRAAFGIPPIDTTKFFTICGCSEIASLDPAPSPTKFLQALAEAVDFSHGEDGLYRIHGPLPDDSEAPEVQWCLDFLYLQAEADDHFYNPNKYICLYSFVYGFLGISDASPYNFILINYLEYKNYIFHGGSILSACLDPASSHPTPSRDRRDLVMKWIAECDENGRGFDIDRPWLVEGLVNAKFNALVDDDASGNDSPVPTRYITFKFANPQYNIKPTIEDMD